MLTRLQKFLPENAVQPGDQIWFVLDVDHWQRKSIEELRSLCAVYESWNIAISNPCFEVWLLFHLDRPIPANIHKAKEFKQLLGEATSGGYQVERFAPLIEKARNSARNTDPTPDHDYPDHVGITKVYFLADELVQFLGQNK